MFGYVALGIGTTSKQNVLITLGFPWFACPVKSLTGPLAPTLTAPFDSDLQSFFREKFS